MTQTDLKYWNFSKEKPQYVTLGTLGEGFLRKLCISVFFPFLWHSLPFPSNFGLVATLSVLLQETIFHKKLKDIGGTVWVEKYLFLRFWVILKILNTASTFYRILSFWTSVFFNPKIGKIAFEKLMKCNNMAKTGVPKVIWSQVKMRTVHEIHNFRTNHFPKTCQKSYIEVSLLEKFNILGPSAWTCHVIWNRGWTKNCTRIFIRNWSEVKFLRNWRATSLQS